MSKVRVFKLANDLGLTTTELLEYFITQDIKVKNHFSTINSESVIKATAHFSALPSADAAPESMPESMIDERVEQMQKKVESQVGYEKAASSDSDRRMYDRFSVNNVNGKMLLASYVKVIDISGSGVCIEADRRLNLNTSYSLTLEKDACVLKLTGDVIRSTISGSRMNEEGESVPVYNAAIRFNNNMKHSAEEILEFVNQTMKTRQTRFDSLRFAIDSNEYATMDCPITCKVKNITFGGLLIETTHPFEKGNDYQMKIMLDDNMDIEFYGRVVYCFGVNRDGQHLYDIGVEFLSMSERNRMLLKNYIHSIA